MYNLAEQNGYGTMTAGSVRPTGNNDSAHTSSINQLIKIQENAIR
jgi:hypothetical protein